MTRRTLEDSLLWAASGAAMVSGELAGLDEDAFGEPTLPGWTRRHLAAHLAANASAVGNLVRWAATGEPTPMYDSLEQRDADIASGAHRSGDELRSWFDTTAQALADGFAGLSAQGWAAEVVTVQGRTVPASETPWMRAREVLVHAVDLGTGVRFADLPTGFLRALGDDVVGKRDATADGPALALTASDDDSTWQVRGAGPVVPLEAPIAELLAYLTGRPHAVVGAPDLPRWL